MRTSTRIPGVTKPATPTTSSTLTAQALMPGGMVAARSAAGADGGQAAVQNRFALVDVGENAAADGILGLEDGALGSAPAIWIVVRLAAVRTVPSLMSAFGRNHAGGRHRFCSHHAVANHAIDQEGACAGNDESEEEDC